jgi:8-oxoguanine deaminase
MTERPVDKLLIKNIHTLSTQDDTLGDITDASVYCERGIIRWVGKADQLELPDSGGMEVIDARNHLVIPGLINTHHHFFQTITRGVAADAGLFGWLTELFPLWARVRPDAFRDAVKIAMAELLLSGCTTAADHQFLYVNGIRLEDEIEAAAQLGIRLHAVRGAISLGRSQGGLAPDVIVESEREVLDDTQSLIEAYHDPRPHSMVRVAVGPCSPATATRELMLESAALARSHGVNLHSHLAENDEDVRFIRERYDMGPGEFAESVGLTGADVWHAHCVKLEMPDIRLFGTTGTGVCHCPCSNLRLASGIAPVRAMLDQGVRIGLGVDGSASNDGGNLLHEARQALFLQRAFGNPKGLSSREALRLATRGGAEVLNRDDVGVIAVGKSADIVGFRLDSLSFAGGLGDPVASLLLAPPSGVDWSVVNGRMIVSEGQLRTEDAPMLIERHNRNSRELCR